KDHSYVRGPVGPVIYRGTVSMLDNGGYVVAWHEAGKIFFQVYNGYGDKVGEPQAVNATGEAEQKVPTVQSFGADGGFIVTWTEVTGTSNRALYSRAYNADGTPDED